MLRTSEGVLHLFSETFQTVIYGAGARVGFFQGDIRLLPDDMKTLQPTVFPVVPRLLNRLYDKVGKLDFFFFLKDIKLLLQ